MHSKIEYLPINWRNGMAFSAAHLGSEYLAVLDSVRDATALGINSYNYGLIGGEGQKKFAESFIDNITNERVEVSFCRAITKDGTRIEILNQNWEELSLPLSELVRAEKEVTPKYWYVLLIVDPFIRIPEGLEDEKESPRRKPFTRPAFQLELMAWEDIKGDNLENAIPLAKFETIASGMRKLDVYIPPCRRVNGHEKLIRKYELYDQRINELQEFSKKIIEKVLSKKRSNQSNPLSEDIDLLCRTYMDHFVNNYDEYKLLIKDESPIALKKFFARFARVLDHAMDLAKNRSHMLEYFNQYATNVSATQLNHIIKNTFEANYFHFDIAESLKPVDEFLDTFHEVFQNLVKLDYQQLAPREVVRQDTISSTVTSFQQQQPRTTSTPASNNRRIRIKNSGKDQFLGDGLED